MSFYAIFKNKLFQCWSLVKDTLLTVAVNPIFLLSLVVMATWVSVLIFGLKIQLAQNTIVSIKLFGKDIADESNGIFVIHSIALTSVHSLAAIFSFLYIIMASSSFGDFLNDPILPILLINPMSRPLLLVAKFWGILLSMAMVLALTGGASMIVLSIKTGEWIPIPAFLGLLLSLQLFLILCLVLFLILLLRNGTSTSVLSLAIFFLLSPLLEKASNSGIFYMFCTYLTLKLGLFSSLLEKVTFHESLPLAQLLIAAVLGVGYIGGSVFMFRKY